MAANLRLIWDNAADRATVTASSEAGSLVAANLQLDEKTKVWRATTDTATLTFISTTPEPVDSLGLAWTNLSPMATVRWQGWAQATDLAASTLFDTTVTPDAADAALSPAGAITNGAIRASMPQSVAIWLAAVYVVRKWVVTITDPGNPAGYVEASRAIVGTRWSPASNFSYGLEVEIVDETQPQRTESGDDREELLPRYRSVQISLDWLESAADRDALLQLATRGQGKGVFVSLYPTDADTSRVQQGQFYAGLAKTLGLRYPNLNRWQAPLVLAEKGACNPAAAAVAPTRWQFAANESLGGLTLTRASAGSRWNAAGVLESKGVNVARYDYGPVTLVPRGLLVWEQRTNSVLQNQTLETAWSISDPANMEAVAVNAYIAPDGTMTMDKLQTKATNATHFLFQGSVAFAASPVTFYFFLRYINNRWVALRIYDGSSVFAASFDLLNGVTGAVTAGVASTIRPTALANVFFASMTQTTSAGSGLIHLTMNNSDLAGVETWNATGAELLGAWGGQLESGSFDSSPIGPVTTAHVARSADVVATSNVSWWSGIADVFAFKFTTAPGAGTQTLLCLDDGEAAYGLLDGSSGDPFTTPDSAANSPTGDVAFVVYAAAVDWTPSGIQGFLGKWTSTNDYFFGVNTDGKLRMGAVSIGGSEPDQNSTVAPAIANGSGLWAAGTLDVDNGAGGRSYKFFTSSDGGATWSQLGTTVTVAGTMAINDGAQTLKIGGITTTANLFAGKIFRAQIYNGIPPMLGGSGSAAPAVNFDARDWVSGSTLTSSATGEVYTINGSGSVLIGGAANRIRMYRASDNHIHCVSTVGSADQCDLDLGAVAHSTTARLAFQIKAGAFAASLNGGAEVTDNSGTVPAGLTTLRIGSNSDDEEFWNGWVAEGVHYPAALSYAVLQGLLA